MRSAAPGYYQRTMAGIELARSPRAAGGCICTFTAQSALRYNEVFDYFLSQGLGFSVHAALPPLGKPGDGWALSPEAHGELLVGLLERYLEHTQHMRISTLDAMSRSITAGQGGICTFGECLGKYLAVDPQGWIYACQRLCGMERFRLGNVHDRPTWGDLQAAPAWQLFQERQERIAEECGDCPHFEFCRGGCPYNTLAADGSFSNGLRDPHCPAYKRTFESITERALAEVFSQENLDAVVAGGPNKHGLLRKGRLLQVIRGGAHPQELARQARKAVAAVALGASRSPEEAVEKLVRAGLVSERAVALNSVRGLHNQLKDQSQGYVNAYLHVTYACNLACKHCYTAAGKERAVESMVPDQIVRLAQEAARVGFRKVVITGGEPLAHPQREELLSALAVLRPQIKPALLVLRTNLAYPVGCSAYWRGSLPALTRSWSAWMATSPPTMPAAAPAPTPGRWKFPPPDPPIPCPISPGSPENPPKGQISCWRRRWQRRADRWAGRGGGAQAGGGVGLWRALQAGTAAGAGGGGGAGAGVLLFAGGGRGGAAGAAQSRLHLRVGDEPVRRAGRGVLPVLRADRDGTPAGECAGGGVGGSAGFWEVPALEAGHGG